MRASRTFLSFQHTLSVTKILAHRTQSISAEGNSAIRFGDNEKPPAATAKAMRLRARKSSSPAAASPSGVLNFTGRGLTLTNQGDQHVRIRPDRSMPLLQAWVAPQTQLAFVVSE